MRGIPDCADCGAQMQVVAGGVYRCPFATKTRNRGIGGGPFDDSGVMMFCDQPRKRESAGVSGHFLGSSDMRRTA